jgi:hypothetical protein
MRLSLPLLLLTQIGWVRLAQCLVSRRDSLPDCI